MHTKQFKQNEPYSVSMTFNSREIIGQIQDCAFEQIVQGMLLREMNKTHAESFAKIMATPADIEPTHDCAEQEMSSILRSIEMWRTHIAEQTPMKQFEPCPVPDWMRPSLRDKGMTDDEIDKIVITGIEPSWENKPGVVLTTVTA